MYETIHIADEDEVTGINDESKKRKADSSPKVSERCPED